MRQEEIRDYRFESQRFLGRAIVAGIVVFLLLSVLFARAVVLQVVEHDHYTSLSRENRVKVLPIPPTRGLIYDRKGRLLAENLPAYTLEIIPEEVDDLDETIKRLQVVLPINENDIKRFKRQRRKKRRFESIPIRRQLSDKEIAVFAVHRHEFPGVDISARLLRRYLYPEESAHVLGYVGRISERDLEQIDVSNYAGTTHIGKIGIEKTYEDELHGKVGLKRVEVNAAGRVVDVLERELPTPGNNLFLHLDIALQRIAMDAFAETEHNGAAVAIDPQTGGVLALVSHPGFNPNLFVEGISSKNYRALRNSPDKPLYNRALRGQYPPGSTIKPLIGLGGLETYKITADKKIFCPGFFRLPGKSHRYRDWKKTGHGKMNLIDAVTQSCDVYFYSLAHEMGVDQMHDYLAQFGFGNRTGIDLTGELPGILPSKQWKRERRGQVWFPGETVIMGIGQGYFLATPVQLAAATASFANGGIFHSPRLVSQLQNLHQEVLELAPPTERKIPIENPGHWEDVKQAMLNVVEGARGTARRIRNDQYRIAGKTGTAQVFTVKQDEEYDEDKVAKKLKDHALFVAYAPVDEPKIAVAVLVENGGHGGSVAAPIAKRIMDAYLLGNTVNSSNASETVSGT